MLVEVAALEDEENRLDRLIENATIQLKHLTEDEDSKRLAYVTYHDIRKVDTFNRDTIIAIKAPAETRLEVPDPREVRHVYFILTIYFLTSRGEAKMLELVVKSKQGVVCLI